jgi:hypothetical protein
MTKSLEETFNLPPLKEALKEEQAESDSSVLEEVRVEEVHVGGIQDDDSEPTKVLKALSVAEKIDHALTKVDELEESDNEMDHIAKEALEAYMELKDLAMNMADAHSSRMMEVAASMLRTSLDAKNAKIDRKLKTIDLQLKKMRMDRLAGNSGIANDSPDGVEFDRNELLKHLHIDSEE